MKTRDFDVIHFLQDRNIRIYPAGSKNVSSGWIGLNCLFCIDPSNHLGIKLSSKAYSCFKCGESGNAIAFIRAIDGVDVPEAYRIMNQYKEGEPYQEKEKHYQSKARLPMGASKNFSANHTDYLITRRFDPDRIIKEYDLYATGPIGPYKHRIIFPVTMNNRMIAFVGRDITGEAPMPYKNSTDEYSIKDVKQCLFNMDSVLQNKVIIVEGIFDALRIGDGAVATFGTQYTKEQLLLLRGIKQAFVLYDADAAKEAKKLAHDLTGIVKHVEILTLSEGDPDMLKADDVRALRKDLGF